MNNAFINTTVTWLKYTGIEISKDSMSDNDFNIIRIKNVPIDRYKKIYSKVGFKYNWIGRLRISDSELINIIHSDSVEIYYMKKNKKIIGFLELDYREKKEIKIVHLGLLEEYIGLGYGKKLLKFAIQRSYQLKIKPITLQTNSLDHPNALKFYQRNGFEVYSRRSAKVIKAEK